MFYHELDRMQASKLEEKHYQKYRIALTSWERYFSHAFGLFR